MKKRIPFVLPVVLLAAAVLLAVVFFRANDEALPKFSLPEGYTMKQNTILRQGEAVGSITRTELNPAAVVSPDWEVLTAYFQKFKVSGREMDYMIDGGAGVMTASLIYVDTSNGSSYEVRHWLFVQDEICYDLLLDQLGPEQQKEVLICLGLEPQS